MSDKKHELYEIAKIDSLILNMYPDLKKASDYSLEFVLESIKQLRKYEEEALLKMNETIKYPSSTGPRVKTMTKLEYPEKTRTYYFPNYVVVSIKNVTHISISPSGTHRLKTEDGRLHIVPHGWVHIEIDAEDWTF